MHRFRPEPTMPAAIGLALCLLAASCIGAGSSDEDTADGDTTSVTGSNDSGSPADASDDSTTTASSTTVPVVADLTEVAWVVNDFDGLVDDQGRVLVPAPAGVFEERRPSVVRSTDGSIYYVLDGRLWRWAADASGPEEVDVDAGEVLGVARVDDGAITVNPFDDPIELADRGAAVQSGDDLLGIGDEITAVNDITVRVLPPDADVDDRGYITEFRSPARLEVERDGEVEWTIDAGGVRSPWLHLVDFDGRFVMMARYPTEPADPMAQHIVYDLDCPNDAATGGGCTRTFQARWGTAALVGPDRQPGDDDLNTVLLDLCPTQGVEIAPPAEMTDPNSFDEDFTDDDLEAFRLAALQLTTCDPGGLGDPEQPGLLSVSGSDDPDENGWMWTDFARSLRGPFVRGPDDTWIWAGHENAPAGVLDRSFSPARLELRPGRRIPGDLAVTVTDQAMLIAGRTDADTAEIIAEAAQAVAEDRGVPLSDWIDTTGAAQPEDRLDAFVASIETDLFDDDLIGEIHLTADGVTRDLRSPSPPSKSERDLGFLMADFASGGEGVYADLPLAADVVVALGSEVVATRQVRELVRRPAWAINSADFAGRDGPFNVLDLVPSPSQVVVGPHARCAGPEAIPAPPELASYTRIGILPLEGSVDSCLDWSAVDLFVDGGGVIRGVSLHLSEP